MSVARKTTDFILTNVDFQFMKLYSKKSKMAAIMSMEESQEIQTTKITRYSIDKTGTSSPIVFLNASV